jgi:hypothetical protein
MEAPNGFEFLRGVGGAAESPVGRNYPVMRVCASRVQLDRLFELTDGFRMLLVLLQHHAEIVVRDTDVRLKRNGSSEKVSG